MTDGRKIERVVFTATGEKRTPKQGEWFLCEPEFSGFMRSNGDHSRYCEIYTRDIYTREVIYADPEPTPDLRSFQRSCTGSGWFRDFIKVLIDRLDAQEKEIEALKKNLAKFPRHRWDQGTKIDNLRQRIEALEEIKDRQGIIMGDDE